MEYMKTLPDKAFELAIVDPPYRNENQPIKEMRMVDNMKRFGSKPSQEYFCELFRVSKNQIIWGANNFVLPEYCGFVIWNKLITGVQGKYSDAEIAYLSPELASVSKMFSYSAQADNELRIHPTQKPVKLYEWLLTHYAKQGDKILDTHLGSGSSRIACYNLGFDFVGCEIDEDYFKAQEERYQAHISQASLFV